MLAYFTIAYRDQEFWRYQWLETFLEKVSSGYQGQTGFRKIRNKLRNVVCSPDISMSYYVFTRTHETKQIRESLLPLKRSSCLSDSLIYFFSCVLVNTLKLMLMSGLHTTFLSLFLIFLNPVCPQYPKLTNSWKRLLANNISEVPNFYKLQQNIVTSQQSLNLQLLTILIIPKP